MLLPDPWACCCGAGLANSLAPPHAPLAPRRRPGGQAVLPLRGGGRGCRVAPQRCGFPAGLRSGAALSTQCLVPAAASSQRHRAAGHHGRLLLWCVVGVGGGNRGEVGFCVPVGRGGTGRHAPRIGALPHPFSSARPPACAADALVPLSRVAGLQAALYGAAANGYLKEQLNAKGAWGLPERGAAPGCNVQTAAQCCAARACACAACICASHQAPAAPAGPASRMACLPARLPSHRLSVPQPGRALPLLPHAGISTTNATMLYADIGTPYFEPPVVPVAASSGSSKTGMIAGIAVGAAAALAAAAGAHGPALRCEPTGAVAGCGT